MAFYIYATVAVWGNPIPIDATMREWEATTNKPFICISALEAIAKLEEYSNGWNAPGHWDLHRARILDNRSTSSNVLFKRDNQILAWSWAVFYVE